MFKEMICLLNSPKEVKIKESAVAGVLNKGYNNPRNSEGSFLPLKDGRVAFAYSRYKGESDDDHSPCDICVIYSYDNGKTFDTEHYETLVRAAEHSQKNVWLHLRMYIKAKVFIYAQCATVL